MVGVEDARVAAAENRLELPELPGLEPDADSSRSRNSRNWTGVIVSITSSWATTSLRIVSTLERRRTRARSSPPRAPLQVAELVDQLLEPQLVDLVDDDEKDLARAFVHLGALGAEDLLEREIRRVVERLLLAHPAPVQLLGDDLALHLGRAPRRSAARAPRGRGARADAPSRGPRRRTWIATSTARCAVSVAKSLAIADALRTGRTPASYWLAASLTSSRAAWICVATSASWWPTAWKRASGLPNASRSDVTDGRVQRGLSHPDAEGADARSKEVQVSIATAKPPPTSPSTCSGPAGTPSKSRRPIGCGDQLEVLAREALARAGSRTR